MSRFPSENPFLTFFSGCREEHRKNVIAATLLFCLIFLLGCFNVTEFDSAFNGGLYVISAQDFTTTCYISGMSGARSLLLYPGNLFIASTEGVVYRYDTESMTLIDESPVGTPSPSGFFKMIMNPSGSGAYLIGSLGQIVEFSLPDCTVEDVFTVCSSPVDIAVSSGSSPFLYVADGPTNSITQVHTTTNEALTTEVSFFSIESIESAWSPDTLLVATSDYTYLLEELGGSSFRLNQPVSLGEIVAMAAIPYERKFVCISYGGIKVLEFFDNPGPEDSFAGVIHSTEIEGSNHVLAVGTDWQHAYVLSYLGDFTCRLTSYNYAFNTIDQQVDLPGFPLDIKTSTSGNIYALTYE